MKELGELLRKTREEKGILLKDIQELTKIRLTYLEAIEQGDLSGIPGEVYRKGFISSYASAVGLNSQEILERYNRIKAEMDQPVLSGSTPMIAKPAAKEKAVSKEKPVVKENPPTKEKPAKKYHLKKGRFIAVFLGVLAGLAILVLVFGKNLNIMNPSKTATASHTKIKATHAKKQGNHPVVSPEVKPEVKTDEPASDETVTKQIYPAPVTIMATFSEPVWVRIYVDGKLFQEGKTFTPNDAQQLWTAQENMTIHMGNPAGIKLLLNGKELGPLGERGVAKVIKITPNGIDSATDESSEQ